MPDADDLRPRIRSRIAWAGAFLFLVSLVWAAYVYLVGFDTRTLRLSRGAAIAQDVALFSIFALHHSLLARAGGKRLVRGWAPPELERSIYTWVASLLFIAVCAWWEPVSGTFYRLGSPWRAVGYSVQLAGVILTIRSSAALDVLDLAGVRQVERANAGVGPRHVALETRGLYSFVRHPLYFAWALMVFGTPDMTATRATFAVVSTAYLALAIPWEERALVETFGGDYESYRQRVRWRMVPGLY